MPKVMDDPKFFEGKCSEDALNCERTAIVERTGRSSSGAWTAVSLSGGGIRSASYCLGALQALEANGLLRKIDYLSTVSGGGYIGGGLLWSMYRDANSNSKTPPGFPYGTKSDSHTRNAKIRRDLNYIRWHANYILNGKGIDIFSVTAVIIRVLTTSLAIWLLTTTLFFILVQRLEANPIVFCKLNYLFLNINISKLLPSSVSMLDSVFFTDICNALNDNSDHALNINDIDFYWPHMIGLVSPLFGLSLLVAAVALGFLILLAFFVALIAITSFPQNHSPTYSLLSICLAAIGSGLFYFSYVLSKEVYERIGPGSENFRPDILSAIVLTLVFVVGIAFYLPIINLTGHMVFKSKFKNAEYFIRRSTEMIGGFTLRTLFITAIIGSLPISNAYLEKLPGATSIGKALWITAGGISGIAGYLMQSRNLLLSPISGFFVAAASWIFIYVFILFSFNLSATLYDPRPEASYYFNLVFYIFSTAAIMFGLLSNSNSLGLHKFYRDRLMELFMPSQDSVEDGRSTYSFAADSLSVSELWKGPLPAISLFPIINCNAILVNDPDPVLSSRGGTNFSITPLHVGSHEHGWESTVNYERKNQPLTLASAIAVSGAAANGNAAYAGKGVTRDRALSLVLTLLNIRLGVWLKKPSNKTRASLLKATPFFPSLWYGLFSQGYRSDSNFVELSDGGHFDNLGIYELVRRKVDLIIALDGEADPKTGLPGIVSLTRRLNEDFGAVLDFGSELDKIMPHQLDHAKYPLQANFANSSFARGTITYPDNDHTTTLIYIKATLTEDAPFQSLGYRAAHPDFPHETTADQFYSPAQFDAYRELGFQCATKAVNDLRQDLEKLICNR